MESSKSTWTTWDFVFKGEEKRKKGSRKEKWVPSSQLTKITDEVQLGREGGVMIVSIQRILLRKWGKSRCHYQTLKLPEIHVYVYMYIKKWLYILLFKIIISIEGFRNKTESLFHKFQTEIILSLPEVALLQRNWDTHNNEVKGVLRVAWRRHKPHIRKTSVVSEEPPVLTHSWNFSLTVLRRFDNWATLIESWASEKVIRLTTLSLTVSDVRYRHKTEVKRTNL